ncbi:hypothetical protein KJ780_01610 [Candidatus Micrarchaeota archaeon]|nr:hypothetical protein [Candidatus Micrarchaeota archaeon]
MRKGRFIATVALATVLAVTPVKKTGNLPFDDRFFNQPPAKMLFLPVYNESIQPNTVMLTTTKNVLAWMSAHGLDKINDKRKAAEEATMLIFAEKNPGLSKPGTVKPEMAELELMKRYREEITTAKKARYSVLPSDYLKMENPRCLERSVFLLSVLRELGINARLFDLEAKTVFKDELAHVFVVAKFGDEKIILDPTFGIVERNFRTYMKKCFGDDEKNISERKLCPFIPYSSTYEKFLENDASERALDKKFKKVKKKL